MEDLGPHRDHRDATIERLREEVQAKIDELSLVKNELRVAKRYPSDGTPTPQISFTRPLRTLVWYLWLIDVVEVEHPGFFVLFLALATAVGTAAGIAVVGTESPRALVGAICGQSLWLVRYWIRSALAVDENKEYWAKWATR